MSVVTSLFIPSLSRRIGMALAAIFATGIAAAFGFFYLDTHGTREAIQARTLQEQARELIRTAQSGGGQFIEARIPVDWKRVYDERDSGYYFTVFDRAGRVVGLSANRTDQGPLPLTDAPPPGEELGRLHFLGPSDTPALTARLPDGGFVVVARTAPRSEAFAESLLEEHSETLWIFAPFGVVAFALITLVIKRTLNPIREASAQAALVGPHDLESRISLERLPIELRPLVSSFNEALDRLTDAYAIEKRITANAAHELRTPLTVLDLRLQRAQLCAGEIDWTSIHDDLARMKRLVSQLLDLARKESRGRRERMPVNLARIAREAVAAILPLAEAHDRLVTVDAREPVRAKGDPDDLRDMVRNLVENALYHGRGTIQVTVAALEQASSDDHPPFALIRVSDEGEHIPEAERDALFERFRKGDPAKRGSGLGLTIVRQVARSHGGDACFAPGINMAVEVSLPRERTNVGNHS
ncbi:MAG: HAMP domain-containing histidine kinase [Hyphomicrobiales bacterium]|nr:HAMP domain-containing histidine kinase [Hyphomicrobiales bacterium]